VCLVLLVYSPMLLRYQLPLLRLENVQAGDAGRSKNLQPLQAVSLILFAIGHDWNQTPSVGTQWTGLE